MNPNNYQSERQIVPSDHAPRKEAYYNPEALEEMTVCEVENESAWISMDVENTMEVKQ